MRGGQATGFPNARFTSKGTHFNYLERNPLKGK